MASLHLPSTLADRTFEAIVLGGDAVDHEEPGRLATLVEELCGAGVQVAVVGDAPAPEVDAALQARPKGPGRLHLCVEHDREVHLVDHEGVSCAWSRDPPARGGRSHGGDDSALGWLASWLAALGITGELVLVAGRSLRTSRVAELRRAVVISIGGARTIEVLAAQLERRLDRRVPSIDDDPAWVVRLPPADGMARAREAMGAVANGWTGTRAAIEEDGPGTLPLLLVNGIYDGDAHSALLPGPVWTRLEVAPGLPPGDLVLDLRTGVLERTVTDGARLRSLRFASLARPHAMALRAEVAPGGLLAPGRLTESTVRGPALASAPGQQTATTAETGGGRITVAVQDWDDQTRRARVVERVAAWAAQPDGADTEDTARSRRAEVAAIGFDQLLAEHRAAWAQRWSSAGVAIEGAPDDELAARFAVFHLLTSAPTTGEAAVGARGLTGPAYGGHVFWDADVYVLPALAALSPPAARAMLEYRFRRLDAARTTARQQGDEGARFPWESAGSGLDVTPESVHGASGKVIAIRTGEHEEHIVADVAWAVDEYVRWSGDRALLAHDGRALIAETARYWASRIRVDERGAGHLYGVIGPDEYHEIVDDNAFTNVMARWNLRRAADLCEEHDELATDDEVARWRRLASALVDGYDRRRGLYEQFAGYRDLEPLLISELATPPVAADVLLGRERLAATQIIKQADVLMLHHLVPGEVAAGSLEPNLAYYDARTAHGSSLSPAISATLFARAGQPERALELFRIAARLDLDDITGTTTGGVHLATMGGLWQALAYGFLGLRPGPRGLAIEPRLPAAWERLELRFQLHGQVVTAAADHDAVRLSCSRPLTVRLGAAPAQRCDPPGAVYRLEGGLS